MNIGELKRSKLTIRSKAIKEGILTHQVDEGSPCLDCGDKCPGFSLHFWRKTCNHCLCPRDSHQISRASEFKVVQVGKLLFTGNDSPNGSPQIQRRSSQESTPPPSPGVLRKLTSYVWTPKDVPKHVAAKYMAALPVEKAPLKDTPGEKYRQYQYARQLPAHDMDINHCNKLSATEQEEFSVFLRLRREKALGRGILKEVAQDGQHCTGCFRQVAVGDVVVRASRAPINELWHPACFVCSTCKELMVDLIYFYHEGKLFCGRHHAEGLLPRCAACDEIIFCAEYTVAESKNWHLSHFCCLRDDKPLGGNRYMMHGDQPFCIPCYDMGYSPKCQNCKRVISVNDSRLTHGDYNWHGTPECFRCFNCSESLIDRAFLPKQDTVFCSKQCFKVAKSKGTLS